MPTSFSRSKSELIGGRSRGASVADVGFASTNPGRAISALGREQPVKPPDSGRSPGVQRSTAFGAHLTAPPKTHVPRLSSAHDSSMRKADFEMRGFAASCSGW